MKTYHNRKEIDLICPTCKGKLSLDRCKQERDTTYQVVCENCIYPSTSTGWYYKKEDAIEAAIGGWYR